ncbi:MAG TPA: methylornithine synthase PylB [Phycisphaerales bacterium]|nr:methylornithine synthase PylB [Phycisphaerales bacterium]
MSQNVFSLDDTRHKLRRILEKAKQRVPLSRSDVKWILDLSEPDTIEDLFKAARKLREKYFDNRVFLYGFLYFSTYCGNSCEFCLYRKNNSAAVRYRKSLVQIIESSRCLSESGIHLIDLTMGEDPEIFQAGEQGFDRLLQTIRSVKQNTNLPLMLSAGVLPEAVLRELPEAGAIWYACYQETHNRALYQKLRTRQDYDIRINSKRRAKELGLLIEEGLLVGVGESINDITDSIFVMDELKADQVRVMSFVPQKGTPMEHFPPPNSLKELLVIALMRLVFPECLIPASLDVGGHAQLHRKLAAGANVVTSLIPPSQGLAGVAQCDLDIEDGKRTTAGIQSVLKKSGLEPASSQEYHSWLNQRLESSPPVSDQTLF